jgi:hypothetical protein
VRRPTKKAVLFFFLALGTGYTLSLLVMSFLLDAPLRLYGFFNLTLVAILIAVLLMIWVDRPFGLGLFEWREPKPKEEEPKPALTAEPDTGEVAKIDSAEVSKGALFPHEIPSDHWDADFGDSKQVYQGSDLPIWILAGWAAFIIWAVVYLVSGLPTAF